MGYFKKCPKCGEYMTESLKKQIKKLEEMRFE